jgi:Lysozyme like domain
MRHSRHHDHRVRWTWAIALAALATGTGKLATPTPFRPGPKGAAMTIDELRALAKAIGFPDPTLAAAVAMAESGGNPFAVRIVTDPKPGWTVERSFGLWQINTLAHPQFDETQLLSASYNAHAALLVSQSGKNWSPWPTYTSGRYLKFMGDASS